MNKLQALRQQSGIKQKKVAFDLGVSRATLWNYENGKRKLTFDIALKLAKIYGVSVADLVENEKHDNEKTANNGTN